MPDFSTITFLSTCNKRSKTIISDVIYELKMMENLYHFYFFSVLRQRAEVKTNVQMQETSYKDHRL